VCSSSKLDVLAKKGEPVCGVAEERLIVSGVNLLAIVAGAVAVLGSGLAWARAQNLATAWRERQRPLYGERVTKRVYTKVNVQLGAAAGCAVGVLIIVMGATGSFKG
jgi:hypothetical protein